MALRAACRGRQRAVALAVGVALLLSWLLLSAGCAQPRPSGNPVASGAAGAASQPTAPPAATPPQAPTAGPPTPSPTAAPSPTPDPTPTRPPSTPSPTVAASPTDVARPTVGATASLPELSRVRAARQAIGADLRGQGDAGAKLKALADSVAAYLGAAVGFGVPLTAPPPAAADALRDALTLPGQRDPISGKPATATVVGTSSSRQEAVVVALGAPGAPALAFVRDGASFRPYPLSPVPGQGGTDLRPTDGLVGVDRVGDVDGDGQPEVVVVETMQGGSSTPVSLAILQWSPDDRAFRSLFAHRLSNWAGPATWKLAPRDGKLDVVLEAPLFGPFDHKLLPHQQETRVFRWDGARYALAERRATPPEYRRQQFNVGEAAFRRGACEEAIPAYRRLIDEPALKPDEGEKTTDWVGFAWLRIGECSALLGRQAEARTAMEKARGAGPALGDLAGKFLAAYQAGDVARALGALLSTDLARLMYEEKAGNLTYPLDATGVLYPGAALAAFAQGHPEALQRQGDELLVALKAAGLPGTQALAADLNGDGRRELVAVVPVGDLDTAWLVSSPNGRWRGQPTLRAARRDGGLRLEGPRQVTVDGKPRQAFVVVQGSQPGVSFALDGDTVLLVVPPGPGQAAPTAVPFDASEFPGEFNME